MSQAQAHSNSSSHGRENFTDMPVGEILRRTRMHYGQSLTDVESILRIRAVQLQALEDGRIDLLPGRVYAIGFVRAYAEYLGLDGEKMVHLFKQQGGNAGRPKAELHFPVPASESKLPNTSVLAASVVGVVIVVAALVFAFGSAEKATSVPEVPKELRAATLAAQPAPVLVKAQPPLVGPVVPGAPATAQVPATIQGQALPPMPGVAQNAVPAVAGVADAIAPAAGTAAQPGIVPASPAVPALVIRILETSWVEVRGGDGRVLLSRVLKPGDSYTVPPGTGMMLDTGNIGGLEFTLNGAVLPPLGAKGDVRRRVSLDPDKLPAPMAAAPATAATALRPAAATPSVAPVTGRE